jgi:hypothetical protein
MKSQNIQTSARRSERSIQCGWLGDDSAEVVQRYGVDVVVAVDTELRS